MLKHWRRTLALLGVVAATGLVCAAVALAKKPPAPPPPPPSGPGLIAFSKSYTGGIYLMNPDGTGSTPAFQGVSSPKWSYTFADGTVKLGWIQRDPVTSKCDIMVATVFPVIGEPTAVMGLETNATNGPHGPIDWSPSVARGDGTESVRVCFCDSYIHADADNRADIVVVQLIYDHASGAFTVDAETQPVVFDPGLGAMAYSQGCFSPDGTWLAFVRDNAGPPFLELIYVAKSDGSQPPTLLIDGAGAVDSDPAWSPDGTKLAFVSDRHGKNSSLGKTRDIYVASLNADMSVGTIQRLTNIAAYLMWDLAYSPDGLQISFYHQDSWKSESQAIGKVLLNTSFQDFKRPYGPVFVVV
jgi:hypothetical protein